MQRYPLVLLLENMKAVELRDGDKSKYLGKGVLNAVQNIKTSINSELYGIDVREQELIDHKMIDLDGTTNKASLGATMLAVSLNLCKTC